MTKYVKTCKIKYVLFYCKSREINLSYAILNLSCFSKNMYLYRNLSPIRVKSRDALNNVFGS
jgi:hypothetical protein